MRQSVSAYIVKALSPDALLGRGLNEFERRNAPRELYVEGPMPTPLATPRVSMVGTRKPTRKGIEEARDLTNMLAGEGVTVVSGLAAGIDTVAHQTAIEAGGKTVAVLGTPLDRTYPRSNRDLRAKIARDHLLVSQFSMNHPITRGNFVRRNHTMALVSDATVIVEAGDGSGTIHQGWEALRLKRPLFVAHTAVKADPAWFVEMAKYGATTLKEHEDVLEELPPDIPLADVFAT